MNEKGQTDKEKYQEELEDIASENLDTENASEEDEYGDISQEEQAEQESLDIDIEKLEELARVKLCPQCPVKQEQENEVMRVQAESENFKKRMEKEKQQYCKFATQSLLEDIIPVIDNLELASQHGRDKEACKDLVEGVDMTKKLFLETLQKHGLEQIKDCEGVEFDPKWHEAMSEESREDMESGLICQIMQTGYNLKDRLLRPAKVTVSKNVKNSE